MSYTLVIGNKNYSSWSMRAWLLLKLADVPFDELSIELYTDTARAEVRARGGETGRVPVLKHGELAIWETLAIAEYLYESCPAIWPGERAVRARARSVSGEMCSGMFALRDAMSVNLRARGRRVAMTSELAADIARVQAIWTSCLDTSMGPWLFGGYSAADVMFAPVTTRFRTYGVELDGAAGDYGERLLEHPDVLQWHELAAHDPTTLPQFEQGLAGPAP